MRRLPQPVRFVIVGGINTAVGLGFYVIAVLFGASTASALAISTIAGTLFNYFTFGAAVFYGLSWARFPRFVVAYLLIYVTNLIGITLLSPMLGGRLATQLILAPAAAVASYVMLSRFVFQPNPETSAL